ncbi:hypothetical protein L6164_024170 [Bauhinia variegata]|uniref:Uncharacterized protein n=1 Tax=Bauhinia variegata TaxID=167791 RepID=A0ACB9LXN3_BAUVA|nr:hypothetical protein L6164_024170 [Bauhinia variegata]
MDIKKHWFTGGSYTSQTIKLGRSYTRPRNRSYSPSSYDSTKPLWQMIWRKIRGDKRKVFSSSVTNTMEGTYDAETYSRNFDQGMGWMEPDNLSRSFSARYADPSRILPPKHLMDI